MTLKTLHFLDWPKKYKTLLKSKIINKFEKYSKLSRDSIYDIYATGSRVYVLHDRKDLFKESSDLDIAIIVKNKVFDETFIPVNELQSSKVYVKKMLEIHKGKLRPKIKGFIFYGIRISLFIFPEKYKNLGNFYRYKLPYYSFFQDKYFENNFLHLLDYETHWKGRVMKYEYCFICKKKVESKNSLHLKIVNKNAREIEFEKFTKLLNLYICDDCFSKLFNDGTNTFVEKLAEIVNQDNKVKIQPKPQDKDGDKEKTFFGFF